MIKAKHGAVVSITVSLVTLVLGWLIFPYVFKSVVGSAKSLSNDENRELYENLPFALPLSIYLFNITNYLEVAKGKAPILQEVGPYYYDIKMEKIIVGENNTEDSMLVRQKLTYTFHEEKSDGLTGDEIIVIPHSILFGVVSSSKKVNYNVVGLFNNVPHPFLIAKAKDILFDGVDFDCGKTMTRKTICLVLKDDATELKALDDRGMKFKFSLFGNKNATEDKLMKIDRGNFEPDNLGKVLEFDNKTKMTVWKEEKCNKFQGTDGSLFPAFSDPKDGLVIYVPEFCGTLKPKLVGELNYNGIPASKFNIEFDQNTTDEYCLCANNSRCYQRGAIDISSCRKAPMLISSPHFFRADVSYLNSVKGLNPDETLHETVILFEPKSGSPLYARKRFQVNILMEPEKDVPFMANLPYAVTPMFWMEESFELPTDFVDVIKKRIFTILHVINFAKWTIFITSLVCALFFLFESRNKAKGYEFAKKIKNSIDIRKSKIKEAEATGSNEEA